MAQAVTAFKANNGKVFSTFKEACEEDIYNFLISLVNKQYPDSHRNYMPIYPGNAILAVVANWSEVVNYIKENS